ncbi:hypothetical protein [Salinifilum ghardaiensis]
MRRHAPAHRLLGVLGELHAVDAAATCRKCPSHDEDGQMAFTFTEPEPELALFPLDEPARRQ